MAVQSVTRRVVTLAAGFGMTSLSEPDSRQSLMSDPGGIVLNIGLFSDIGKRWIAESVVKLHTSGYASPGIGAALYARTTATGAKPYRACSQDGAWWELAESRIQPEMLGLIGQSSTQTQYPIDGEKFRSILPSFRAGQLSLAAGASVSRRQLISSAGKGESGLRLDGGGVLIHDLLLQGAGALDQGIGAFAAAAALDRVHVRGLELDTTLSSGLGHGVNLQNAMSFCTLRDIDINARGYGILTYTGPGVGNIENMRIIDFTILGGSDAIELNTPEKPQRNTVVWGGHLQAAYARGSEAGFSLGLAHCEGFVVGGFLSIGSTNEGLHIEDGSSMGVASAFVLRNTGKEAVRHYKSGHHAAEGTPIVFSSFAANRDATVPIENTSGFYAVYAPGGVQGRSPIVAGYLRDYETGLRLDGAALFSVGHVSVDGAKNVISLSPGGRALSATLFSNGAKVLVEARGGGAEVGAIHQEAGSPTDLISTPRGEHTLSCLSEFSCPATQVLPFSLVKGSYAWLDLFPAPALLHGRLRVRLEAAGSTYWSGTVTYDGTTISVADSLTKSIGPQAIGASASKIIRIYNGLVQLSIYSDSDASLSSLWIHFHGEYLV